MEVVAMLMRARRVSKVRVMTGVVVGSRRELLDGGKMGNGESVAVVVDFDLHKMRRTPAMLVILVFVEVLVILGRTRV